MLLAHNWNTALSNEQRQSFIATAETDCAAKVANRGLRHHEGHGEVEQGQAHNAFQVHLCFHTLHISRRTDDTGQHSDILCLLLAKRLLQLYCVLQRFPSTDTIASVMTAMMCCRVHTHNATNLVPQRLQSSSAAHLCLLSFYNLIVHSAQSSVLSCQT